MSLKSFRSRITCAASLFFLFGIVTAWAMDSSLGYMPDSSSTAWRIKFLTGTVQYMNKDNDSAIVGNFLSGSYYDTTYGFFQFNWSADPNQNVRIISSTDKCWSGYGYKLGWYAKSTTMWFVNFSSSTDGFVYYCESDNKLHGYAYSDHVGAQVFEGLPFLPNGSATFDPANNPIASDPNDPFYSNNVSSVLGSPDPFSIQGETNSTDEWKESTFYIIK